MTELGLAYLILVALRYGVRRPSAHGRHRVRPQAAVTIAQRPVRATPVPTGVSGFGRVVTDAGDDLWSPRTPYVGVPFVIPVASVESLPQHRRRVEAPVAGALERALERSTGVTSPADVFRLDPLGAPFVVVPELAEFYSEVTQEINTRGGTR